jgi:hypothetical protein
VTSIKHATPRANRPVGKAVLPMLSHTQLDNGTCAYQARPVFANSNDIQTLWSEKSVGGPVT